MLISTNNKGLYLTIVESALRFNEKKFFSVTKGMDFIIYSVTTREIVLIIRRNIFFKGTIEKQNSDISQTLTFVNYLLK